MSDNSEELKNNMSLFDNEKLCQFVVVYRYLNYNKELSILAMQELANRRGNGDIFDFESYIEKCLSELPPINITPFDINSVFNLSLLNRKKS